MSTEQSSTQPVITGLQIENGNIGDIDSSVNLFRGDVNFPFTILSLNGHNGLQTDIKVFYQSNIHDQVTRWNQSAPTGLLGVGWGISFDSIVVDTKNTGTHSDDAFYLIIEGATVPLYRTDYSTHDGVPVITFQSREFSFWTIHYYPNNAAPEKEYWQIVKDNGERYTFGLNGIQWGVRWDNWVGATTDASGTRFPVAWNLVKIETLWNDFVTFTYENDNILVGGNSNAYYTQASRVATISDSLGRSVTLNYQQKEPFEIQLPHIAPGVYNAYQFKYEEKYLDSIVVFSDLQQILFTTEFSYAFLNVSQQPDNDNYKKRYLTSIRQINDNHAALPSINFTYWDDANSVNPGAIKSIVRPYGGTVSYEYTSERLESSAATATILPPGVGYSPLTWPGSDYTVVAWYNQGLHNVSLSVYTWGGSWKSWQSDMLSGLNVEDLNVRTGGDFFVVYFKDLNLRRYRVLLFKESPWRYGEWQTTEVQLDPGISQLSLCIGDNFVAMQAPGVPQLIVQQWDGLSRTWVENLLNTGSYDKVALCGINNVCLAAYYDSDQQSLYVRSFYGDRLRLWQPADQQQFNVAIDWEITKEESFWSVSPTYAIATYIKEIVGDIARYDFLMVQWREDFQFMPASVFDYEQDKNTGNPVGYSISTDTVFGNGAHIFRYSGQTWNANLILTPKSGCDYRYAYGADLALAVEKSGNSEYISSRIFDPYQQQWVDGPINFNSGAADEISSPSISGDTCIVKSRVYVKDASNDWQHIYTLPDAVDERTIQNRSPFYIAWQLLNDNSTWVLFLKDGQVVGEPTILLNEKIYVPDANANTNLAGMETFITYTSDEFKRAAELCIHRVINQSATGQQVSRSVSQATIDSGYQTVTSYYQYDLQTATYDPRGLVAQYVRAKTYRHDPEGKEGYTENIYFNGLNPTVTGVDYPDTDAFTNVKDYFSLFNGRIFQSLSWDGNGQKVARTTNYLYAWDQTQAGENIYGVFIRLRKKVETAWLAAFELESQFATSLNKQELSLELKQAFALQGFTLSSGATVTTEVSGSRWGVNDPSNRHKFTLCLSHSSIQVSYAVDSVVESDFNSMGQIASSTTRSCDASGKEEVKVKTTQYAWEFYPSLKALNLLQPWALKQTFNQSAKVITALSANTYKNDWGSESLWASHKEYTWDGTAGTERFDFDRWSGDEEPPRGWLKTSQVNAITRNGLVTDAASLDGTQKQVIYDKQGRFPVAVIHSVNKTPRIASYYGFEAYEETGPWVMSDGSAIDAHLCDNDCYTGTRSLRLSGTAELTATFSPDGSSQIWLLSGWLKNGGTALAFESCKLSLTAGNGQTLNTRVFDLPDSHGQWQHVHQAIRAADFGFVGITTLKVSFICAQNNQWLLLDNIAFAPLWGADKFSAWVYDNRYKYRTASLDMLGNSGRIVYDRWQRAIAEIGSHDVPKQCSGEELWRLNGDVFNPGSPNATFSQAFREEGIFDNFRQGNLWQQHWDSSGAWTETGGMLVHSDDNPATLTAKLRDDDRPFSVRMVLTPQQQTVEGTIGFSIGDQLTVSWEKGMWSATDDKRNVLASFEQPVMDGHDLWFTLVGCGLLFWLDGRCILRARCRKPIVGKVSFATSSRLAIDYALLGLAPQTSAKYLDNAKRSRQSQTQRDEGVAVAQVVYDELGREAILTRTAQFDGSLPGYRPDFVKEVDWQTGVLRGELAECYPDDEGFSYTRTLFDKTPMSRVILAGIPGKSFAITGQPDQKVTTTAYAVNITRSLLPELPAGQYPLSVVTDPDKLRVQQYSDKSGRVIATIEGDADAGPGCYALTRHYFDNAGNCVRTELPNYFDSEVADAGKFVQTRQFDFLGRMVQKQDPDCASPYRYVYDSANRIRFMQDPNGAGAHYILYWLYDALGRVTEEGSCNASWDESNLRAHADDSGWLPAAGLWAVQRVYDGDGHDISQIGKVVTVRTSNSEATPQVDVEEFFLYDIEGRVTEKSLSVPAFDACVRRSRYQYDNLGNRIQVCYPDSRDQTITLSYQYDSVGQLSGIRRAHGNEPAVDLARYRYNASGALQEKIFQPDSASPVTRRYRYNSPGWLTDIDDDYFSEQLTYDNGYDGAAYYAGKIASTRFVFKKAVPLADFLNDYQYLYAYDALGRLKVAVNSVQPAYSLGADTPLDYDANNNITGLQRGSQHMQYQFYAGSNRLQNTQGDSHEDYHYNANGNVIQAVPRGIAAIVYDRNKQQALSVNAGSTLRYQYDGQRLRVLKTNGAQQTLYLMDAGGELLASFEKGGATHDGDIEQTDYVHDKQGIVSFSRGNTLYTVLNDHNLSTRLILDGSNIAAAYNYQPFGSLLGPVWEPAGRLMPYLFTGQEFDVELGLYHFKVRFYDTDLGRFFSVDPAGEFASPYTYAGNDPIYFIDPSGQFSWGSFFAVLAGIALVVAGAALTIATAGAAAPLQIAGITVSATATATAGAVVGGALVGAGVSSAVYGASHTSNFNAGSWAAMLGVGAAFGAITGGIGLATGGISSSGWAIVAESGIGAIDGYISNGVTNVINGQNFNEGGLASAAFGGLFGAFAGVTGRWTSFRNGRLLRNAPDLDAELAIASTRGVPGIRHSVSGIRPPGGRMKWFELVDDFGNEPFNTWTVVKGGGSTTFVKDARFDPHYSSSTSAFSLGIPRASQNNASRFIANNLNKEQGSFNMFTNGCTAWTRKVIRSTGMEPPPWAITADSLQWWARLMGARRV